MTGRRTTGRITPPRKQGKHALQFDSAQETGDTDDGSGEEGPVGANVDPLLECLVHFFKLFGHARSADSVRAGLPLDDEPMGPNLFCEAAENLGLNAAIVRQKNLHAIPEAVLPCLIFLKGGHPVILLERDKTGRAARIYLPETQAVKTVDHEKLNKGFTGYAIYCHPASDFHKPERGMEDAAGNHWFWGLIRECSGIYGFVILASVFINILALASPLFVMNVYDRVLPNNAIETGWVLGIGALTAFAFDFLFRTLRGYLIDFAGRKIDIRAARRIYDQLLNIRLSERPPSSGAFANMLRDFDAVREFVTSATITAFVDLPFTLIFLLVILSIGAPLAYMLVALMILVGAASYLIQLRLKKSVRRSAQTAETRHGLLVETIQGLETIKTIGADGRFRVRYGNQVGENADTARESRFLSALGVNIALLVQQSASVVLILIGMYMVQEGSLSVGALIASVILAGRAIAPIGQLANLMTRYHQAQGALNTLNGLMQKPVERPVSRNFLHRPDLQGNIVFDKVAFAYPGAPVPVLHNVSFEIRPGERVGIIGRIGSGKSTIARLMLKLYDPQEGTIRIDGTDVRQIDPADLRRAMACIAQDVVLFSGSVRENITAGFPQATQEQVLGIAKITGVHDFVSHHPMGYDAPVGEMGQFLSGGQRQAVALARAMLTNPRILLCDEPTNAMDMQAENVFCDYVRGNLHGRTFIMITHKQSMLPLVDRLILMHQGTVVMDGPRDEVIAALQSGKIKVQGGSA
ncbi:MAG: type I secretion system permease/ATPase [Alphaproteobacteria bacterium]|nr:type I secretion system permease/ATPase [Alphaproteobacteria bacterium]MCB9974255.1 type I secretion system permease/ATPase [Rhodospirillales bacterium]